MDWLEKLRELKAKTNLSTREISEKSGLPEPTLEKLFAGKTKNPGINTIRQLVHALGYTLDDLDDFNIKKSPAPAETGTEEIALEESNNLLVALGYIQPGEQISDDDLSFLTHVIGLLDAWFDKGH